MKDRITEIRELRSGFRVTMGDGQALFLRHKDQRAMALREGDTVDAEELKRNLLLEQYTDALNRAVRLLAVRARSAFEIEKRLTDACYLEDTVEMVLTKLQSEGFVNDEAFAGQWVRERATRQIGKARILYELRLKGIDPALAERAVLAMDPGVQDESAAKLAAKLLKRYRSLPEAEARRKATLAMQRRGYSYAEAKRGLEGAAEDGDGNP